MIDELDADFNKFVNDLEKLHQIFHINLWVSVDVREYYCKSHIDLE